MTTFKEYVLDWFHQLVKDHSTDENWLCNLFTQLGYDETEYPEEEGQSIYDFLMEMSDGDEIYEAVFGRGAKVKCLDDLPDTESFLVDMFRHVGLQYVHKYGFAVELLDDMAWQCLDYTNPINFFKDLQHGGCVSGMIGMFVYHNDCKRFYIEHIDDMESFVEDLEDEIGCGIQNRQKLPHYTFICWVCYEELAHKIASELWNDEF